MRSKTSKPSPKRSQPRQPEFRPWKAASACSEGELGALARMLAHEVSVGHRVLMEGPMGAGKTTFSRVFLDALGVVQPPEGSPSFAIAHEYRTRSGMGVVHIDFYRIRDEQEIAEAGIDAYFWERSDALVIAEWTSLWSEFEQAVLLSTPQGQLWKVELAFVEGQDDRRRIQISRK